MTGPIQNAHGFDLGIAGLRAAGQGEHLQGPLLCFVEGIGADHDPADDAPARLVRGHGFNTIDFEHGFKNSTIRATPPSRPDALELFEPLDKAVPLQFRQTVDPEDAVELIDLVLEADSHQAFRLLLTSHSVKTPVAHPNPGMALKLVGDARHGDAPLHMPDHVGGGPNDVRINIDVRLAVGFQLDDHEPS